MKECQSFLETVRSRRGRESKEGRVTRPGRNIRFGGRVSGGLTK